MTDPRGDTTAYGYDAANERMAACGREMAPRADPAACPHQATCPRGPRWRRLAG